MNFIIYRRNSLVVAVRQRVHNMNFPPISRAKVNGLRLTVKATKAMPHGVKRP